MAVVSVDKAKLEEFLKSEGDKVNYGEPKELARSVILAWKNQMGKDSVGLNAKNIDAAKNAIDEVECIDESKFEEAMNVFYASYQERKATEAAKKAAAAELAEAERKALPATPVKVAEATSGGGGGGGGGGAGIQRRPSMADPTVEKIVKQVSRKAKAAKKAEEAKVDPVKVAAESARFTALYDAYAQLPFMKNKVKRTGWTKEVPGYKKSCWGNSWGDVCIILLLFVILYISVALIFWGLLSFALATDNDFEALYIFAGLLVPAWGGLMLYVYLGGSHQAERKARLEEM